MVKLKSKKHFSFLSANMLKLLAVTFMLCDHLWVANFLHGDIFNIIGRLAFPIFAFQVSEGYVHTKSYKKYWHRLLIFAVISEIPFNFFYESSFIYPFHQNVLFTLLFGLVGIRIIDNLIKDENRSAKKTTKNLFAFLGIWLLSFITLPDYGALGMLTVVLFYVCRFLPHGRIFEFVGMVILHWVVVEGKMLVFEPFGYELNIPVQAFAVFALIPIWLYNGEKGKSSRTLQYSFYAFYPLHMFIIYLCTYFAK